MAVSANAAVQASLEIHGGRIQNVILRGKRCRGSRGYDATRTLDLSGYLLLPGLINAHDHLEFNLFPRLGEGPYLNYQEWARDIYHPERSPVREHLRVPKSVRLWWGAIKNLLCGVTTVCHHNDPITDALHRVLPVRVIRRLGWAHSLAFGENIGAAFARTPEDQPFVIHVAEGTDRASREEVFRLERLGVLSFRTGVVHGVGLDSAGHRLLRERRVGLVWCPTSNLFTLGKTLGKCAIMNHERVALGSDSAMTGKGDLLDEILFAYSQAGLSPEQIFGLVTHQAAAILHLRDGEGTLRPGAVADLIAVQDRNQTPCAALADLPFERPELVMEGGKPRLLSPAIASRWPAAGFDNYEIVQVGRVERLVKAPIQFLLKAARQHLGEEIRLAGSAVSS